MRIKRSIPKQNSLPKELSTSSCSPDLKEEIIDLDDLVNDEAFEEELDELNDHEMVIDESKSQLPLLLKRDEKVVNAILTKIEEEEKWCVRKSKAIIH